jgi:NAD(P)-dependent dehydrogenase (short-subunit alcohol dehydrogenase family)
MNTLQGKTALITGGSKGIGYGGSPKKSRLREGMNVAITSRYNRKRPMRLLPASRRPVPAMMIGITADVRDFGAQQAAVAATLECFRQSRCAG